MVIDMYQTVKKNIFTIIFTLTVFVMFAGYLFGDDGEFSVTENRYLAKRPPVTLSSLMDGSFMKSFELYTEEQLPLRDRLIKLKAVCCEAAFKNENNGIAKGKDGHLFEKLINTDRLSVWHPALSQEQCRDREFCKTDRQGYLRLHSPQFIRDPEGLYTGRISGDIAEGIY